MVSLLAVLFLLGGAALGLYLTPFTSSESHVLRDHMHVFYVITHHAPAEKGVNWGVIS